MGEVCSICKEGELEPKSVEQIFSYKNQKLKYQQTGLWCNSCNEAILSSTDMENTEKILDGFRNKIDA